MKINFDKEKLNTGLGIGAAILTGVFTAVKYLSDQEDRKLWNEFKKERLESKNKK